VQNKSIFKGVGDLIDDTAGIFLSTVPPSIANVTAFSLSASPSFVRNLRQEIENFETVLSITAFPQALAFLQNGVFD